MKDEDERTYCQYRRRQGDEPGLCEEVDLKPCGEDLGDECWFEDREETLQVRSR